MAKYEDHMVRKRFLSIIIGFDIAVLIAFKYASFIAGNCGFELSIALPIGISFFTFQIMSYVFDVYYQKVHTQKSLVNIALYVSLFPQLIAGPIVRYETIASEIEDRTENTEDRTEGMVRFVIGLSKKILIANYVGFIADRVFDSIDSDGNISISVASAWLGAIAYTLQIYFDFSGYSDMAIGLGRFFGFHFLENFNYPYIAKSITDFWRRWHISLSTWFRDYVYISLGGNRVSKSLLVRNLFVVWLLTGVWHGANWTFIVWGLFYFILLLIERFTGFEKRIGVFSRLYTLFFVIVGWVLFRSPTIPFAGHYLSTMFGFSAAGFIDDKFYLYLSNGKWFLMIGIILSTPIVPLCRLAFIRFNPSVYKFVARLCVVVLFTLSILVCIKLTYNPFIYFNF
ncbi:alginate O-acetylation protein [Spirochaetia bacterium]|nr:alginate O-acetylation protein [Spirochaetia bacterium]